jgi:hypothetical protein
MSAIVPVRRLPDGQGEHSRASCRHRRTAYVDEEAVMNKALSPDPIIGHDGSEPQPLPPRLVGEMVGVELMRMAWMARHLGVEFDVLADWDDEVCPAWPTPPTIPSHVWPYSAGEVDDAWTLEYHRGLSAMLARAGEKVRDSSVITEAVWKSNQAIVAATS